MTNKTLTIEELKERTIRFYNRYNKELERIKELLNIRLEQLAHAYTMKHNLPVEAIQIYVRVKSLKSFLNKLDKKKWPQYYYPTEVVKDLIGARVVCWFVDDCEGIKKFIESSKHIFIEGSVKDYIDTPKKSGYRSIHLIAKISYDSILRNDNKEVEIVSKDMPCEIQIRTKLQDAWGDVTHEFHYKAQNAGVNNKLYEGLLSEISHRLASEDKSLLRLRDAYQELADEKTKSNNRESFKSP